MKTATKFTEPSKYFDQIILNFGIEKGDYLKKKWEQNNPGKLCTVIDIHPDDDLSKWNEKFSKLAELTSKSRLYIVSHGDRLGENFFHQLCSGKEPIKYSYDLIANFLALYLTDSSLSLKGNSPLRVSLVSCHSGLKSKDEKDFFKSTAANLNFALRKKGINTEVVARTYYM